MIARRWQTPLYDQPNKLPRDGQARAPLGSQRRIITAPLEDAVIIIKYLSIMTEACYFT